MKKEKYVAVFVDNEERKLSSALVAMYERSVTELEKIIADRHGSVSDWWKHCLRRGYSKKWIKEEFRRKGYWELSSLLGWAWFTQIYLCHIENPDSCPRSREWQIREKTARIRKITESSDKQAKSCPFDGYGQLCKENCSSALPPANCPACRK